MRNIQRKRETDKPIKRKEINTKGKVRWRLLRGRQTGAGLLKWKKLLAKETVSICDYTVWLHFCSDLVAEKPSNSLWKVHFRQDTSAQHLDCLNSRQETGVTGQLFTPGEDRQIKPFALRAQPHADTSTWTHAHEHWYRTTQQNWSLYTCRSIYLLLIIHIHT